MHEKKKDFLIQLRKMQTPHKSRKKTGRSQEIEPEKVMFKKTKAGKAKAKRAKTLKTKAKDT